MLKKLLIGFVAMLAFGGCGVKTGGPGGPIGGSDATFEGGAPSDPLSRPPVTCKEGEVMNNGACMPTPPRCLATEVYLAYLDQCVANTPENACFSKGQVLQGGTCAQNAYYSVCILKTGRTPGQENIVTRLKTVVADNACEGSYAKLAALKTLDISKVEKEVDLRVIGDFTQLEELVSEYNLLTSAVGVEKLRKLKVLNLSDNSIASLTGLDALVELEELVLEDNKIKDITPLRTLKKLKKTDLSSNSITSLSALQGLTNLEELDLSANDDLTDLRPLSRLDNLESLRIKDTAVENLVPIADLPLTTLDLDGSSITDLLPDEISEANCPVVTAFSQVLADTCTALMSGLL